MNKPVVTYDPKGESGNIFFILAKVRLALRKQRRIQDFNDCWERVQKSKSYPEALEIIKEYCKVAGFKINVHISIAFLYTNNEMILPGT